MSVTLAANNISDKEMLLEHFEASLVNEMLQYEKMEFPAGINLSVATSGRPFLPLVLQGRVRISRIDSFGEEITYYPVDKLECCILSITASLRNAWGQHMLLSPDQRANVIAETPGQILAIPTEMADIWMNKYESWRKYVLDLYQQRLRDLIQQHELATQQRNEIYHQKKQITDSIRYAQRIQGAVLRSGWYLEESMPEHFIYFRPRDIVSGDFYWMSRMKNLEGNRNLNDLIIIAVADCTGHGVPGAFMSMLGMSFLNEIITHYNATDSGGVLDILRQKVKQALQQSVEKDAPHDGMDISLCIVDQANMKLQFAGANNPMYIIRANSLIEVKATRNPIGSYLKEVPFQSQTLDIHPGDLIYMFSDGFGDQFGGPKGDKYKSKRMKELFLQIHQQSIPEQKESIQTEFENWINAGDYDQVDDVLVVGIQF